jgi:hypothetical protein
VDESATGSVNFSLALSLTVTSRTVCARQELPAGPARRRRSPTSAVDRRPLDGLPSFLVRPNPFEDQSALSLERGGLFNQGDRT